MKSHLELSEKKLMVDQYGLQRNEILKILSGEMLTSFDNIRNFIDIIIANPAVIKDFSSAISSAVNNGVKTLCSLQILLNVFEDDYRLALVNQAIYPLLEMALNSCKEMTTAKNLTIINKVSANDMALIEEHSFAEIMLKNILSNAIKFSPRGQTVEISARTAEKQLILSIRDYGIGIPKEMLARIFDINKSDLIRQGTEGEIGMGISLTMVQKLMEKSAGTIHIDAWTSDSINFKSGTLVELTFKTES
jgi:signal transduction histidine kinase